MWQVAMTQCEVTSAGLYRDPDLATSCQCGGAWHGEPPQFLRAATWTPDTRVAACPAAARVARCPAGQVTGSRAGAGLRITKYHSAAGAGAGRGCWSPQATGCGRVSPSSARSASQSPRPPASPRARPARPSTGPHTGLGPAGRPRQPRQQRPPLTHVGKSNTQPGPGLELWLKLRESFHNIRRWASQSFIKQKGLSRRGIFRTL